MSNFMGIQIAQRAMQAHRAVLEVIGQNIANAGTPGYTRRVAQLSATSVTNPSFGSLGTGVEVSRIARKRAVYLDGRFRSEQASVGEFGVRSEYLASVEGILGEPGENGISAALDDFFAGWSELSGDPSEPAHKQEIVSRAERLAGAIRKVRSGILDDAQRADEEFVASLSEANNLLRQVAELNNEIQNQEMTGNEASGLRDQRDLILDQLSVLAPVRISEGSDGAVTVSLGGRTLVDHTMARELRAEGFIRDGVVFHHVRVDGQGGDVSFDGGTIGALQKLRDQTLPSYLTDLDKMAASLIERMNTLHEQGASGTTFFTGTNAADIGLNEVLRDDPSRVDGSTSGDAGDNDLALLIAGLGDERIADLGGQSYAEFYRGYVGRIGGDTASAKFSFEASQATLSQVQSQKESIEAVSLDEEMANMITTEHAYEAAARLMATASEMLDTLLRMV